MQLTSVVGWVPGWNTGYIWTGYQPWLYQVPGLVWTWGNTKCTYYLSRHYIYWSEYHVYNIPATYQPKNQPSMINTRTMLVVWKFYNKKTFPSSLPVVVVSAGMEILEGKLQYLLVGTRLVWLIFSKDLNTSWHPKVDICSKVDTRPEHWYWVFDSGFTYLYSDEELVNGGQLLNVHNAACCHKTMNALS
jgi:hypothetical protein